MLDSEQKTRGRQHAFEAVLNADLETACSVASLVRIEQPPEIFLRDGTAVGSTRERRQNLLRAALPAVLRTTDKHPAAARRVAGTGDRIRTTDQNRVDGRVAVIQLVGRACEAVLRRLKYPGRFVVLPDERDRNVSRPCFHRETHFQAGISRLHVHFPLGIALILSDETLRRRPALAFTADIEPLEQHAVQADFDLMRITHPDDVVVQLPPQKHLDGVLAIDRKMMTNHRAALRPEGKVVARALVLHQRFGNLISVDNAAIEDRQQQGD